jgi:hypothetical protein
MYTELLLEKALVPGPLHRGQTRDCVRIFSWQYYVQMCVRVRVGTGICCWEPTARTLRTRKVPWDWAERFLQSQRHILLAHWKFHWMCYDASYHHHHRSSIQSWERGKSAPSFQFPEKVQSLEREHKTVQTGTVSFEALAVRLVVQRLRARPMLV